MRIAIDYSGVRRLQELVRSEQRLHHRQQLLWEQLLARTTDPAEQAQIRQQLEQTRRHLDFTEKKQDMLEEMIHRLSRVTDRSEAALEDTLRQLKREF